MGGAPGAVDGGGRGDRRAPASAEPGGQHGAPGVRVRAAGPATLARGSEGDATLRPLPPRAPPAGSRQVTSDSSFCWVSASVECR
ncbi:hypothetical protein GB931_00735 [Modestobacter sp. I12A-02628]|nr:hypothetical protein [Goekera deserti]